MQQQASGQSSNCVMLCNKATPQGIKLKREVMSGCNPFAPRRSSKRPRSEGSTRGRGRGMQRNARTCVIAQYNRDTHAFIRRRVRVADPDAILQLRLPPPPLPLSWGKAIKPYNPNGVAAASSDTAAAAAVSSAGEAQAVVPRGLVGQPCALPASRNCTPRVCDHTSSSSSAGASRECRECRGKGAPDQSTCSPCAVG